MTVKKEDKIFQLNSRTIKIGPFDVQKNSINPDDLRGSNRGEILEDVGDNYHIYRVVVKGESFLLFPPGLARPLLSGLGESQKKYVGIKDFKDNVSTFLSGISSEQKVLVLTSSHFPAAIFIEENWALELYEKDTYTKKFNTMTHHLRSLAEIAKDSGLPVKAVFNEQGEPYSVVIGGNSLQSPDQAANEL